jgi:hypothetical protein
MGRVWSIPIEGGGYRDMDKVEKMDCRANDEIIFVP